jgi:hypothetical protein
MTGLNVDPQEGRTQMIKSSVTKTAVLLLLLIVFSSSALDAAPVRPNMKLRISDGTGTGVVIVDNGGGDNDVDGGEINFVGFVGSFFGGITLAWSEPEDVTGGEAILRLQSQMGFFGNSNTPHAASQLFIGLEDTGYQFPETTATLTGTLTGVNVNNGVGNFQIYLNRNNQVPNFGGPAPMSSPLNPVNPTPPAGSAALFIGSGASNVAGQPAAYQEFASFDVVNPYALFSEARIDYSAGGSAPTSDAHFTLEARVGPDRGGRPLFPDTVPVPEPTTLLLLGSGLVSLGLLGKKRPTA